MSNNSSNDNDDDVDDDENKDNDLGVLKQTQADLASLNRVSHRLAMTDDGPKLGQVLEKLLPRLLQRLGDNHKLQQSIRTTATTTTTSSSSTITTVLSKIHSTLIEILSHIMKRVRDDVQCPIPVMGILQLLLSQPDKDKDKDKERKWQVQPLVDPFTMNLSLAFLTCAVMSQAKATTTSSSTTTATTSMTTPLLPGLLVWHEHLSTTSPILLWNNVSLKSQWHQMTHLLFRVVDKMVQETNITTFRVVDDNNNNTNKRLKPNDQQQKGNNDKMEAIIKQDDPLSQARQLLATNESMAQTFYDFSLDILLYQTMGSTTTSSTTSTTSTTNGSSSTVPPPGMSQAGTERLQQGPAPGSIRDWKTEMAPRSALVAMKCRWIDALAPSRQWALFNGGSDDVGGGNGGGNDHDNNNDNNNNNINTTRMLALFMVAAGDVAPEVSQRASTYLKHYLEHHPQDNTYGTMNKNSNNNNAALLLQELLILCVGTSNAQLVQTRVVGKQTFTTTSSRKLGWNYNDNNNEDGANDSTNHRQAVLAFTRRKVSDSTYATLVEHASKLLQDVPQIFSSTTSSSSNLSQFLAHLAILASSQQLSLLRTKAGLTVLRGKSYIGAAQLLQALVVRLTTMKTTTTTTFQQSDTTTWLPIVLPKCMEVACTGLSTVLQNTTTTSTNRSTNPNMTSSIVGSEGNTAVRDALYGVICILARYPTNNDNKNDNNNGTTMENMHWLFAKGVLQNPQQQQQQQESSSSSSSVSTNNQNNNDYPAMSIDTATLLFGCITREEEVLRPRAVAALDALLAAYNRLVTVPKQQQQQQVQQQDESSNNTNNHMAIGHNPWAGHSSQQQRQQQQEEKGSSTAAMAIDHNPWGQLSTNTTMTDADSPFAAASAAPPPPRRRSTNKNTMEQQNNQSARKVLSQRLLPLLWNAAQHSQPKQARVAAARWATDLLRPLDVTQGCHLLCFLSGDADVTASSLAKNALYQEYEYQYDNGKMKATKTMQNTTTKEHTTTTTTTWADFAELTKVVLTNSTTKRSQTSVSSLSSTWRPNFWEFTPKGRAVTVEYLLQCLLQDLYGGDDDDAAMQLFVSALASSIVEASRYTRQEYMELLDESAIALSSCLSTSVVARTLLVTTNPVVVMELNPQTIRDLSLSCPSSKARRLLAESWGHLQKDLTLWSNDRDSWIATMKSTLQLCNDIVGQQQTASSLSSSSSSSSAGNKHGAAFLAGTCVQVYRQQKALQDEGSESTALIVSTILSHMGKEVVSTDDVVANAFADGLAIACSYDQEDAPILQEALAPGMAFALTKLTEAIHKYGNGETIDVARVSKLAQSAGTCLAATTASNGSHQELGEARLKCVDALFVLLGSTAFRKDEEVALWAGEALAQYADAYSPKNVQWSTEQESWPATFDEKFAKGLPPHQHAIYMLLRRATYESNPQKRTASAPALFAIVARAAKHVNLHASRADRCLVKELCKRLEDVQRCFISLLADPKSKHLSRESCCLGLAACRSLAYIDASQSAGDELNGRLLRAFGQTTVHGGSAMQESPQQAAERRREEGVANESSSNTADTTMMDAEVGGASGIGEASLGAYREMAGAAMSLGRPDILYALLLLSVSNPAWTAGDRDYGASALLGQQSFLRSRSNAEEMRNALRGHLGKLLPRILRGCHSPNKETREQMQNLWNGLTGGGAEARAAISQHLLLTVDTLIGDTSDKLWRTRLGACAALAQVIVGRSWKELGGGPGVLFDDDVTAKTTTETTTAGVRLLRLWRVAMRALDDVRSNVREAGESLGRGVRSLTLRLVNPESPSDKELSSEDVASHKRDASAAAATALRWLIKHGLNQQCAEASGVCVSCLVGIVDVANPAILQPLVPDLLRSLLLSMSSLEPAALSYLQVRAAGQDRGSGGSYDTLERLRLQLVQTGPMATAVTKCMDMMPRMDLKIQKAVVPELDSAIRLSAGLTTRTAAADCVSTLCSTCPDAFRNTGPSSTNPSVSLLRALYWASERERGQAARDKYAHACGNLAALCPGPSVRSLALRASDKYNASTGSNDDPAARKAAAITLRAIAVKASNQFRDGGSSDIWCRRVLPVAFLGMRDSDPKVASLFADVWEEGGSAANHSGAADGSGSLLEEKLISSLVKECVNALKDVSWSRRVTGAMALKELATKEILSPAPRRLRGAMKDSILEESVRAQRRAQASNTALVALVGTIADTRLWSGKNNVVESCALIASKWSSAFAGVADANEILGLRSDGKSSGTDVWAPLVLAEAGEADSLFQNDHRFSEKIEQDLAEEVDQSSPGEYMEVDEDPANGTKLDFGDEEGLMDEPAEASGVESSLKDNDAPEVGEFVPTYIGLCRMFLVQTFPSARSSMSVKEEEVLPYRASVLQALGRLLESINNSTQGSEQKKIAFPFLADQLLPLFDHREVITEGQKEESPLIVSRAIDCIAACFWEGYGEERDSEEVDNFVKVLDIVKVFEDCSSVERPWTVKTSAMKACARLVSKADTSCLRDYSTLTTIVGCASLALKDRKFWRVRHGGLEALNALVTRCGHSNQSDALSHERHLLLEAALPQKEVILSLVKQTLRDSEAKVTELASRILSAMSWWP